jgi:Dolichyl-phosphate-mannose-protein mannosyltransferase
LSKWLGRIGPWGAIVLSVCGYGLWLFIDSNWLFGAPQMLAWIQAPVFHGRWPIVAGWPEALVGTVFILMVGGLISIALLPVGELDQSLGTFLAFSILFGFASAGWGVQISAALGVLYLTVQCGWLLSIGLIAGVLARLKHGRLSLALVRIVAPAHPPQLPKWQMLFNAGLLVPVTLIMLLAGFHSLAFPVTEWDALIYHVGIAKLWFMHRPAPPIIAGPSVGIEMSYNFPSLFPAVGTFYYLLTGGVHDVYLRLLPPVLGLATLVLVYRAARRTAGIQAGIFAVAATTVTPLFFLYVVFPTSYAFLMPLVVALLYCVLRMWETGETGYVLAAATLLGVVGNLTYLSVLAGVYLVGCGLVSLLCRKVRPAVLIQAVLLALLIASPVYLRNWLSVGNPVFPLGGKIFHSQYIPDQSVLRDSLAQVKSSALGYWGSTGNLIGAQIETLLWDRFLLPVGSLAACAGVFLVPSSPRIGIVLQFIWVLYVSATQLLQRWFWLRTLTMLVPSLAILVGVTFARCLETSGPRFHPSVSWPRLSILTALLAAVLLFPGLTLAWTGPSLQAWTPYLGQWDDYAASWKHIGDAESWLQYVDTGDYRAWRWLQAHLVGKDRVATLEVRWYYLGDASFFYLDGIESAALLRLSSAPEIARYLLEHNVRYILVTPLELGGASRYPLLEKLVLYRYLGTPSFPLIARYELFGHNVTRIYGINLSSCRAGTTGECPQ